MKQLGIWMDHSIAHLMEFTNEEMTTKIVECESTYQDNDHFLNRSENVEHNKKQRERTHYYKQLGDAIKDYDEVLLFGPTTAKDELLNLLRADHLFEKIKIEVESADKMTDHQMHAFVKEYFNTSITRPLR